MDEQPGAETCIDANRLVEFADAVLSDRERGEVRHHLLQCADCRRAYAATTAERWGPGGQIGRFTILERIGSGATGVVYAARDRELGRKVALKILRTDRGTPDGSRKRLVREARMLAKVEHPNVVTIYDAGLVGDDVFIAMECIEGQPLHRWRQAATPTQAEIVDAFRQAAMGLAAAHDAGVIHRDFKPANVLVGADRRVRIADFGLARTSLEADAGERGDDHLAAPSGEATADGDLTSRSGMVIGTPAYMAPEQVEGRSALAASDQYAFCIALTEALTGTRATPPDIAGCPPWIQPVLRRGLQEAAGARYPSMRELLDDLVPPTRGRSWFAPAMLFALAVVGLLTALLVTDRDPSVCGNAHQYIRRAWGPDTRGSISARFAGAAALRPLFETLDAYATDWASMRERACQATRVHGEQSERVMDLRMACLDRRLSELEQLTKALLTGDQRAIHRSVTAAHQLVSVEACADVEAMAESVPPPRDRALRTSVERLASEIDRAVALARTGHYERSVQTAEAAVRETEDLGYRPLRRTAYLALGLAQHRRGNVAEAERAFRQAIEAAAEVRDDLAAAQAWIWLLEVVAIDRTRHHELPTLADAARAATVRAGNRVAEQARLLGVLGSAARDAGRHEESLEHARRQLALVDTATPDPILLINALDGFAISLSRAGRYADAQAQSERALPIARRHLGDLHPTLASLWVTLGNAHYYQGRVTEAETHYQQALAVWTAAVVEDAPMLATIYASLGDCRAELGAFSEADAYLQKALAIWSKLYGPDHPEVAVAYNSLAILQFRQQHHREGIALLERALEIWRTSLPLDDPTIIGVLINLGLAYGHLPDPPQSERYCREALTAMEAAGRTNPSHLIPIYSCIGNALERGGKGRDARSYLQQALDLAPQHPLLRAEIEFGLARALVQPPADHRRAAVLARRAHEAFRAGGAPAETSTQEVSNWLARHGREPQE